MPEPLILLCGPALDAGESAASLDLLRRVALENAAKFLVTTGKFDSEGEAKTVNVEANYPAETAHLQTLLRWADIGDLSDPRFRDGYDLYCLRRILGRFKKFHHAVVLRDGAARQDRWPELQERIGGRLFLTFGEDSSDDSAARPSLIINVKDPRTSSFLDAAWELYRTGAVYGMPQYALDDALSIAVEALELEQVLRQPIEADSAEPADETLRQDEPECLADGESE